jgi:hypothetical protein
MFSIITRDQKILIENFQYRLKRLQEVVATVLSKRTCARGTTLCHTVESMILIGSDSIALEELVLNMIIQRKLPKVSILKLEKFL